MRKSIFFLVVMVTIVVSQEITIDPTTPLVQDPCDSCLPNSQGPKGIMGERGYPGEIGEPGEPGKVYYRGAGLQCGPGPCPTGVPGEKGDTGKQGVNGDPGNPGRPGEKGQPGDYGMPGTPGPPGLANGDVMYLPYKPGDNVGHVCYRFRKICAVPGLRNGWRGWYREGQSGYMIYNKWMYFVTLSDCPCEYNKPSAPQPAKPRDCVRLGECQSYD